jgi:hypothetical protein
LSEEITGEQTPKKGAQEDGIHGTRIVEGRESSLSKAKIVGEAFQTQPTESICVKKIRAEPTRRVTWKLPKAANHMLCFLEKVTADGVERDEMHFLEYLPMVSPLAYTA